MTNPDLLSDDAGLRDYRYFGLTLAIGAAFVALIFTGILFLHLDRDYFYSSLDSTSFNASRFFYFVQIFSLNSILLAFGLIALWIKQKGQLISQISLNLFMVAFLKLLVSVNIAWICWFEKWSFGNLWMIYFVVVCADIIQTFGFLMTAWMAYKTPPDGADPTFDSTLDASLDGSGDSHEESSR